MLNLKGEAPLPPPVTNKVHLSRAGTSWAGAAKCTQGRRGLGSPQLCWLMESAGASVGVQYGQRWVCSLGLCL